MTQPKARLATFGISHFCEKARWALDWHGIPHEEVGWPLGLHQKLAKRSGAKTSSLPLLLEGGTVVQGSDAIIDWAETRAQHRAQSLVPKSGKAETQQIERRGNEIIGPHVRRLALAETLPSQSHLVKPGFFQRTSGWHRLIGLMMWPIALRVMMRMYDIRPGAASESRAVLESELDWLDSKLADGRPYLSEDRFSRVDLTIASLLGPFARTEEMDAYRPMLASEALAADTKRWRDRPVMRWVVEQYRVHRSPRTLPISH